MQDIAGYPRRQQMPHRGRSDERGLLGRLGDDGVAGGKRGGDLSGEDRQRKIPRRDAGEDAAPVQRDLVALAGRTGQPLRRSKFSAGARRVVAQKVGRLADFRQCRRDRAPALADDRRHQPSAIGLVEIGRPLEGVGADLGRSMLP